MKRATVRRTIVYALVLAGALLAGLAAPGAPDNQRQAAVRTGASGLPVPRFVSLKTDRVNVRKGPSTEHSVAWVFSRAGLPVEVIAEFDNWRQIRDSEGSEGWVYHALLSSRRTALVMPWASKPREVPLYEDPSRDSAVVAQLEPGVLGSLQKCEEKWCAFSVEDYTGWIPQDALWGVYSGESLE